jgi:formyl-CoA transferase
MLTHRFFEERGTFGSVDYPEIGPVGVVQPPYKFSDADAHVRGRAPEMGEHNRAILTGALGMTEAQIEELIAENVLAQSPAAARNHALANPAAGPVR